MDDEPVAGAGSELVQAYVARRLILLAPVLVVVSFLVFLMMHSIPGDPAQMWVGFETADPAVLEAVRHSLGLDRPILVQYGLWAERILTGDLGESVRTGRPIGALVGESLPVTVQLTVYGLVVALAIGVPAGIAAATSRRRWWQASYRVLVMVGLSVPQFWLGALFILAFSVHTGWFPLLDYPLLWSRPFDSLKSFFLPALTLGIPNGLAVARMVRASVLEVLGEDYVRVARAKGLAERVVLFKHVLRNALLPVVTLVGIVAGYLLGGAVVVEQVFAIPGVGRLGLQAIVQRDHPVLQAVVLIVAALFVVVNLLTDLLYAAIDPRVEYR